MNSRRIKETIQGYWYILPIAIVLFLFVGVSLILGVPYSLTKYNLLTAPKWVGFDNYIKLMGDKRLWESFRITIHFVLLTVPIQLFLSTYFALLLAKYKKTVIGNIARMAIFIPVISSNAVVGTVWKAILNNEHTWLNAILHMFGLQANMLLGSSDTAWITVGLISVWKQLGYFTVLMMTAVLSISDQYYEAAVMDGANKRNILFRITLPLLKPALILNLFLAITSGLQTFDLVYTLTGGGPSKSTTTLVMYLYDLTFKSEKAGYAMAVSNVFFVISMIILLCQKRLLQKETSEI